MCFGLLMFGYACFEVYTGRGYERGGGHIDMHREPVMFWIAVAFPAILGLVIAFGNGESKK